MMCVTDDRMATREEKSPWSCTGMSRSCIHPWFPLVGQDLSAWLGGMFGTKVLPCPGGFLGLV